MRVRDLTAWRGDRRLFSGIGFQVESGELLHVRGTNGSGKTTLLRMLCGLRPVEKGSIEWCGTPLPAAGPALRAAVAFVGHSDGVKLELTALQNVVALTALRGGSAEIDAEAALAQAGLAAAVDVEGRALSAGQRRRVALAVLLARFKPLWILDEPFTALDSAGLEFAADLVQHQTARGGMVIITSHHELPRTLASARHLHLTPGQEPAARTSAEAPRPGSLSATRPQ